MRHSFTAEQIARLRAFRDAALQVRNASVIDSEATISLLGHVDEAGNPEQTVTTLALDQTVTTLANEPFRSFAMSLRLVYMNDEPANFGSICNLLRTAGPSMLHDAVDGVRARYDAILDGGSFRFGLHGDLEGRVVGPREVFETWLYYGSVHQALSGKSLFDQLSKSGPPFVFAVNSIALSLAACILGLADLIAQALEENQLPRVTEAVG